MNEICQNNTVKTLTPSPLEGRAEAPPPKPKKRPLVATDISEAGRVKFWERVAKGGHDECWEWQHALNRAGYGVFCAAGVYGLAHRLSFQLMRGEIPSGLFVDHMCRNRACVNPSHLRIVTLRVNNLENSVSLFAINAAKTHCIHGHPFSGDNLKIRIRPSGNVMRRCLKCHQNQKRDYLQRIKLKSLLQ